jgi:hypothetical protein
MKWKGETRQVDVSTAGPAHFFGKGNEDEWTDVVWAGNKEKSGVGCCSLAGNKKKSGASRRDPMTKT